MHAHAGITGYIRLPQGTVQPVPRGNERMNDRQNHGTAILRKHMSAGHQKLNTVEPVGTFLAI